MCSPHPPFPSSIPFSYCIFFSKVPLAQVSALPNTALFPRSRSNIASLWNLLCVQPPLAPRVPSSPRPRCCVKLSCHSCPPPSPPLSKSCLPSPPENTMEGQQGALRAGSCSQRAPRVRAVDTHSVRDDRIMSRVSLTQSGQRVLPEPLIHGSLRALLPMS